MPDLLRLAFLCTALCVSSLVVSLLLWRKGRPLTIAPRVRQGSLARAPLQAALPPRDAAPPRQPEASARAIPPPARPASIPEIAYEEDRDLDPTKMGPVRGRAWITPPTEVIVVDDEAATDEPTQSRPLILLTATARTDKGLRRKRNEDSILSRPDDGLFVVADGMGGYSGGEVASQLAVSAIAHAFDSKAFPGAEHPGIPRKASELARAIQLANVTILDRSQQDRQLEGMGTTVCAARFSPKNQRLYIGHVGDSRIYRLRHGALQQLTADHTMKDLGVVGDTSAYLSRAVGIWPTVPIDVLLGKPCAGDVYLLCSDGLTKMLRDDQIARVLVERAAPTDAVEELIRAANASGGKDNVSVVVVRVQPAP